MYSGSSTSREQKKWYTHFGIIFVVAIIFRYQYFRLLEHRHSKFTVLISRGLSFIIDLGVVLFALCGVRVSYSQYYTSV